MIRVILDTNVWISLLLKRSERSSIPQVLALVFSDDVELFVPQELIEELRLAISKSVYLASRIPKERVNTLVEQLYSSAFVPPVAEHQGKFTRDPKDDYLLVYSFLYAIDYLVTGDFDLLDLDLVGHLKIVTPSQFIALRQ